MAINQAAFAITPRIACVNVATANTARDGTGTVATLITGAATGTRVAEITIKARVTTTAGQIRLFLHDGTNFFIIGEIAVPAATVSATVQSATGSAFFSNLVLPSASWSIRVSSEKAESIDVTAYGADL